MPSLLRPVCAAPLIAAVLLAGCGGDGTTAAVRTVTQTTTAPAGPAPPRELSDLVEEVRSGIVRIETQRCDERGTGTGFLMGPRLVATVEHVVDGASSITLKQRGRVAASGVVSGADRDRDVALVRTSRPLEGRVLSLATESPRLGDTVAAIGYPLGLPLSVTRGSVSGKGRRIPIDGVVRRGLIQTDAAVSPGNSGGPLVSLNSGRVVGLVDIDATEADGIAFAVSSRVAGPLLQAWRAGPQPVAASGGCFGDDVSSAAAEPPQEHVDNIATFDGDVFSIAYPGDWTVESSEKPTSFGTDTTIAAPGDGTTLLRVDVSREASDPESSAAPVIAAVSRLPEYVELDRSPVTLAGHSGLHWEFIVREKGRLLHKEDVFLVDRAGRGIAVLTQAPQAGYEDVRDMFDAMRDTLLMLAG